MIKKIALGAAAALLASPALADNDSFNCVPTGNGAVVDLGRTDYGYRRKTAKGFLAGSVVDARGATFRFNNTVHAVPWNGPDDDVVGGCADSSAAEPLPRNTYPFVISTNEDICVQGGTILGDVSWRADWSHHYCNAAAFVFDQPKTSAAVEGMRIDNAWDGIRFAAGSSDPNAEFTVRDVWVSNTMDDGIENDQLRDIVVEDSLFENLGASFLSMRPGANWDGGSHRLTHKATITDVLVSFREYIANSNGDGWRPRLVKGDENMPALVMNGVVMALPHFPAALYGSWGLTWRALAEGGGCTGPTNMFLWVSDAPLPWLDPATAPHWPFYATGANSEDACQANPSLSGCQPVPPCFTIKTGCAAREHWNVARTAWIREHSDVPRIAARTLPDGSYVPADPPGRATALLRAP